MTKTRMLLSHNFDLGESEIPNLSRETFTQLFATALQDCAQCRQIDNPHWIVEVLFDPMQLTPAQMGDRLVQALSEFRRSTLDSAVAMPEFVVLGGLKTSPPTSASPDALQPDQWGVDVVETPLVAAFLAGLNWDAAIADRPPEGIFKSILRGE
jgi:hypothetical protein